MPKETSREKSDSEEMALAWEEVKGKGKGILLCFVLDLDTPPFDFRMQTATLELHSLSYCGGKRRRRDFAKEQAKCACWVQMVSMLPPCRSCLLNEHLRAVSVPSSAALPCHQDQLRVPCLLLFPLPLFGLFLPIR